MTALRNVFACLVHEHQDCVIDLVHNLRCLDPASRILLYDGGGDKRLLQSGFPFERYNAVVVPQAQPMTWGRLHGFALDCMRFLLGSVAFDTLTVVDSDQLAVRPDYSLRLAEFLHQKPSIGMLVNCPDLQREDTAAGPAQAALRERHRWLPVLSRFGDAERHFPHWSFWPSTVFTSAAVSAIVRTVDGTPELQALLESTQIWATEEVVFPTLVALLGYQLAQSPFSFDYVKFRAEYSRSDVTDALDRPDVFWIHPVGRTYEDPVRAQLRSARALPGECLEVADAPLKPLPQAGDLVGAALRRLQFVDGWLEEDEAELLVAACMRAVASTAPEAAVVEVGSYHGRSTVALGTVVAALSPERRVYAIDPHAGLTSARDSDRPHPTSTLATFLSNIERAALTHVVVPVQARSFDVSWDAPIAFLFIDGLHDYANVARDLFAFEPALVPGGLVAFHDYADYYPEVQTLVRELIATGRYRCIGKVRSLVVAVKDHVAGESPGDATGVTTQSSGTPLVSCIMPTADRPLLVRQAITYFLRQEYANRELIVVDSGAIPVSGMIPRDDRIRYVRHQGSSLGELRNLACEHARGEIVVHWDDDDWSAPWRLSYQVNELLQNVGAEMCGLAEVLFFDPAADRCWKYRYPSTARKWVCGGTLCYYKDFWRRRRFPNLASGEDTRFVWDAEPDAILVLRHPECYVATIHEDNTSRRQTAGDWWEPQLATIVHELLGADQVFYSNWSQRMSGLRTVL